MYSPTGVRQKTNNKTSHIAVEASGKKTNKHHMLFSFRGIRQKIKQDKCHIATQASGKDN